MSNDLAAYGYTEATLAPSLHHCSDNLVDVVIEPPAIVLLCYSCRRYWQTGLSETGGHKSLSMLVEAADQHYPKRKRKRRRMRIDTQLIELRNLFDIVACGGEVKLTLNDHQFALVQDGMFVVANVDGEQCRFVGMTEREIKNELYAWLPGAWR